MYKSISTTTVALGVALMSSSAFAAGFSIREQSAQYQGTSFAGNAAGTGLSVMFWNPAGTANKPGPGIFMESHYSIIAPRSEVTVTSVSGSDLQPSQFEPGLIAAGVPAGAASAAAAAQVAANVNANIDAGFAGASPESGNIGALAITGASYASHQIAENIFVGFAMNSPFGLVTEPDNELYQGSVLGRTTSLLTFNANPTVAFRVAPGITVGAGAQLQFGVGRLKFATGLPGESSTSFRGDGWAFGGTAGVMLEPTTTTRVGVGYRSRLRQHLSGTFATPGLAVDGGAFNIGLGPTPVGNLQLAGRSAQEAEADIELPDTVTVSLQQELTPVLRFSATFEWANWSTFEELRLKDAGTGATIQVIDAQWDDSYFYSAGLDYDFSPVLTVRGGIAYEISPTSAPEKRLTSIPDADRLWLSVGATYMWSEATSLDFAYTHVFVKDARFDRDATIGVNLQGDVESSVDIISASMKTRW